MARPARIQFVRVPNSEAQPDCLICDREEKIAASRKTAKAVAEVGEGVVLARVEIAMPPERVFRALTSEDLTKWWCADGVYRTTNFTMDPRPGGQWSTDGVGADGSKFHVAGEVLEIDPLRRLVQT